MKFRTHLPLLLATAISATATGLHAQSGSKLVERRDQADGWYVPVHGKVTAGGEKAADIKIELYKNNELVGRLPVDDKGRFVADLDIDQAYALFVTKAGFQSELLWVDTTLPKERVQYEAYECMLNLEPAAKFAGKDEGFYLDFPSAMVRWNEQMKGFYHNEAYLSHIQTKVAGYAQASF